MGIFFFKTGGVHSFRRCAGLPVLLEKAAAEGRGQKMRQTRKGQTLVEVVVAVMISAATTMAVFSVIVSSFASQKKADKREAAGFMLMQAHETLRNYVSAWPHHEPKYSPCAPPLLCGVWPADASGLWALEGGSYAHDVTSLLANTILAQATLPSPAPTPSLTYTVTDDDCLNTVKNLGTPPNGQNQCKKVVFTLVYQDQ